MITKLPPTLELEHNKAGFQLNFGRQPQKFNEPPLKERRFHWRALSLKGGPPHKKDQSESVNLILFKSICGPYVGVFKGWICTGDDIDCWNARDVVRLYVHGNFLFKCVLSFFVEFELKMFGKVNLKLGICV